MPEVVVTVKFGQTKTLDLALPYHISSQVLAGAIADALGVRNRSDETFTLAIKGGEKKNRVMNSLESLSDAGVMFGDVIFLLLSGTTSSQVPEAVTENHNKLYLSLPDGETVSISSTSYLIGRFSPNNKEVDLDLTPWDTQKLISRRHAHIKQQDGSWFIVDQSSNGTWLNDKKIVPNQAALLTEGDTLRLGSITGIVLRIQGSLLKTN